MHDLYNDAKELFIEVAIDELKSKNEKVTVSRVNVITGIHRKDISKRLNNDVESLNKNKDQSLIMKVIGHWQTDPRFTTKKKQPRQLTYVSQDSDFRQLVLSISKELNPTSILFELERIKAVEKRGNKLQLLTDTYAPLDDLQEVSKLLLTDMSDLVRAVEQNVSEQKKIPNLHARTEYDKIRSDAYEEINQWFIREGHRFHSEARNFLSQFDNDINPDPNFSGKCLRVSLGTFSSMEDKDEN